MEKLNNYLRIESKKGFKILIEFIPGNGPGLVNYEKNCIVLNQIFLMGQIESYNENYLIGVLYHEIGHLKYFMQNPITKANFTEDYKTDSEYYAFEYSFMELLKIAYQIDPEPLRATFKNISDRIIRIQENNFDDEDNSQSHIKALLKISASEIYIECDQYLKSKSIAFEN